MVLGVSIFKHIREFDWGREFDCCNTSVGVLT